MLPVDPLTTESSWQCDKCKGFLPIDQVIKVDNNLVGELQRVNKKSLENLEKFHNAYENANEAYLYLTTAKFYISNFFLKRNRYLISVHHAYWKL